ncbi:uncharacterized protein LOC126686741 [Mercurialis annua]|uniref:uncharacterized protein LOC126686741 n=1 Tax=Mercurialis annua TaxID=3986 RepID=UPI00215FC8F2|nr:uncharacterized protein LOC126686741 [Mercurialis annua]
MQHQEADGNPVVRYTRTTTFSDETKARCRKQLLRFALALISTTLACYLTLLAGYAIFYKVELKFHAPKLRVDEVKAAYFNVSSSSHIMAHWKVNFTLENPNHNLFYQNFETSLLFKDVQISSVVIPDFYQDESEVSKMQASIVADSVSLNETGVGKQLIGETEGGILNFVVTINANLSKYNSIYWIGLQNTQRRQLNFRCEIKCEKFVGWSVVLQEFLVEDLVRVFMNPA